VRRAHRRPGRGHVYRRGSTWWTSLYREGRRIRKSSRSTRKGDALAYLAEQVALLKPPPFSSGDRLSDLLGALVTDFELNRRRSTARLRICVQHLKAELGNPLVGDIDSSMLFDYAAKRSKAGAGPGTVNLELGAIRRAFRLAKQLRRVASIPEIRFLKEPPPRQGFVEREQLDHLVAALPASVRPLVQVAYLTGWRMASELQTRRWAHVDLPVAPDGGTGTIDPHFSMGGWLRLNPGETKNGEGREFPFTVELRRVLEAQAARARDLERRLGRPVESVFFDHETGRRLGSIRAAWRAAVKAAGCSALRPHDLRRSAVRNLERAGVPRSAAMRMVGHKTTAMYDRYAIVDRVTLQEASAKIDLASKNHTQLDHNGGRGTPTSCPAGIGVNGAAAAALTQAAAHASAVPAGDTENQGGAA
jgi:integrase